VERESAYVLIAVLAFLILIGAIASYQSKNPSPKEENEVIKELEKK